MPIRVIVALLFVFGAIGFASCDNSGEDSADSVKGGFRAGFASVSLTPELTETEWTDYNGNGRFDGDAYDPAGEPADCGKNTCPEPFTDTNGNGHFDAVWMAGFSIATPIVSVHDDIYSRCMVLSESGTTIGLCALDLIGYFRSEVEKIRQAVAERGIELDYLMVASTHNHNSPDTMGIWGPSDLITGVDVTYMDRIIELTTDAVAQAYESMQPAKLTIAGGDTADYELPLAQPDHYRNGLAADYRNPILTDQTMTVLKITSAADDSTIGSVLHWSNHPEMHHQNGRAMTSDYPHYIRTRLEEKLGGTAIYWTGPVGGLLTPLELNMPLLDDSAEVLLQAGNPVTAPQESWEQLRSYGTMLADFGLDLLDGAEPLENPRMSFAVRRFFLPVQNADFVLGFGMGLLYSGGYDENGIPIGDDQTIVPGDRVYLLTETAWIDIGDLSILTLPGEYFPENWIGVPDEVNDPANYDLYNRPEGGVHASPYEVAGPWKPLIDAPYSIAIGLANDEIGYVVPTSDFVAGGEEGHYEESRCLSPQTETLSDRAIRQLLAGPVDNTVTEAGLPPQWP